MDNITQYIALLVVALAAAYFLLLLAGETLQLVRAGRLQDERRALLRAQLDRIGSACQLERERQELSWSGFRKFRIAGKVLEADSICSFYFEPHDKRPLPGFLPGQYLTFQLDIPGQTKPVIRCYSLSDSPTRKEHYRCTIKQLPPPRDKPEAPGGLVSGHFHQNLEVGDIVDVKAPSGHFHLNVDGDGPVVLIGGGIGLTPVLSMLNYLTDNNSPREIRFFYGVRNSSEHVMKDYLNELAAKHPNVHLHICYSDPLPSDEPGRDYQHNERVSVDLFKQVLPSNNYDYFLCGPPPMMASVTEGLEKWGVPDSRVHFEAFGPASVKKVSHPETVAQEGSGIEVEFARSGKKLTWDGSANSLLEFAEANGIAMDCGCRAGSCGSCQTAVRSGSVNYTKEPDFEAEDGSCLTCVSVPKSALSLDA